MAKAPKTPEQALPRLSQTTEALESELLEDLSKHAENAFSAPQAAIEQALSELTHLEASLDQADRLLEQTVQQARQAIHDAVSKAVQAVDQPLDKLIGACHASGSREKAGAEGEKEKD